MGDQVERRCQVRVQRPQPPRALALGGHVDGLDRVLAAAARPESVGLRLEPRLPLGLQRVHDPCLVHAVEDHRNPERALLAARLGDVHPPDRHRLERLGVLLHPVDQLHLGLRGQHDLAVHACRQTTGVALRHPPHAHQRVRARAEHQLLQPADPLKVPRLRCREDPLPQPPYVRLRAPPVNLAPTLSVVLWSTHHNFGVQLVLRFRDLGHLLLHRLT